MGECKEGRRRKGRECWNGKRKKQVWHGEGRGIEMICDKERREEEIVPKQRKRQMKDILIRDRQRRREWVNYRKPDIWTFQWCQSGTQSCLLRVTEQSSIMIVTRAYSLFSQQAITGFYFELDLLRPTACLRFSVVVSLRSIE